MGPVGASGRRSGAQRWGLDVPQPMRAARCDDPRKTTRPGPERGGRTEALATRSLFVFAHSSIHGRSLATCQLDGYVHASSLIDVNDHVSGGLPLCSWLFPSYVIGARRGRVPGPSSLDQPGFFPHHSSRSAEESAEEACRAVPCEILQPCEETRAA